MVSHAVRRFILIVHRWGLFIGPLLFFIILSLDLEMESKAQTFLAIFSWTISQWFFTRIPLFITGLLGVTTSIFLGVAPANEAFAPFSNSIIFLFLGGFLFAKALEVMRFDRKISLMLLTSKIFKGDLKKTIFGIFSLTAIFSMWVSNTATTAMMLPIILGIIKSLNIQDEKVKSSLLLGMAYSATIGGLGTPIGSPPNMIAVGMLHDLAGIDFGFLKWFFTFIPAVVLYIFGLTWWMTKDINFESLKFDSEVLSKEEVSNKLNSHEKFVIILFLLTVFFWFSPSIIKLILGSEHHTSQFLSKRFSAGVVSIFFASLLFVFPLKDKIKILDLKDARSIDWPSLILFGSGLSLGGLLFKTGLANMAGDILVNSFGNGSQIILVFALVTFTVFMTEVASNTAAANILIPIVIASAKYINMDALPLVIAVTASCNMAFMLPVATPPNAIIYGSGEVKIGDMMRSGLKLNIVSIFFIVTVVYLFLI